jgi:hypothetical protein
MSASVDSSVVGPVVGAGPLLGPAVTAGSIDGLDVDDFGVGWFVGILDGLTAGFLEGLDVGEDTELDVDGLSVGCFDGLRDGWRVGSIDGLDVGEDTGPLDGLDDGLNDGEDTGLIDVGWLDGLRDGWGVGLVVDTSTDSTDGLSVGEFVGHRNGCLFGRSCGIWIASTEVGPVDDGEDDWFIEFDLVEGLGICNLATADTGATEVGVIVGSIEGRDVDGL